MRVSKRDIFHPCSWVREAVWLDFFNNFGLSYLASILDFIIGLFFGRTGQCKTTVLPTDIHSEHFNLSIPWLNHVLYLPGVLMWGCTLEYNSTCYCCFYINRTRLSGSHLLVIVREFQNFFDNLSRCNDLIVVLLCVAVPLLKGHFASKLSIISHFTTQHSFTFEF